jgi:hypothetical protein
MYQGLLLGLYTYDDDHAMTMLLIWLIIMTLRKKKRKIQRMVTVKMKVRMMYEIYIEW